MEVVLVLVVLLFVVGIGCHSGVLLLMRTLRASMLMSLGSFALGLGCAMPERMVLL